MRWLAALLAALALAGCGAQAAAATGDIRGAVQAGQTAGGSIAPPGWGRAAPPRTRTVGPTTTGTAAMFDSITLETLPPKPFALAGYTSGYWPTYLPMRAAYPSSHVVSIAVTARYHADCLDVEPGDAAPAEAPAWVRADRAAGFARPCLYSSYYEYIEQLRPALARAGIKRSEVWEWDADYTYTAHIDLGFDATQWTDVAYGRNLDESLVDLPFLSIAQPPWVPPKPNPCGARCQRDKLLHADIAGREHLVAESQRLITYWRSQL